MNYYKQTKDETLQNLQTTIEGLSSKDVQKRIDEDGLNELQKEKKKTFLKCFLDNFMMF